MSDYIGRFAPSPTGPLHFGSLVAAVGSYLQARTQAGLWLVRMEDLDPPREVPGAADQILRALEHYGFEWHGPVEYQSRLLPHYEDALATLFHSGHAYPCGCSRKDIQATAPRGEFGPIYPGTCRVRVASGKTARVVRVITHDKEIVCDDAIAGRYTQRLESQVGDFVIKRGDGLTAYQLAVVVDDARQGITEVVRGSDLLDSTPRQLYLQTLLDLPTPSYVHLPIAINQQGQKLSKQTHAQALATNNPVSVLVEALEFLDQNPPEELLTANLGEFWQWAADNWSLAAVPRQLSRCAD